MRWIFKSRKNVHLVELIEKGGLWLFLMYVKPNKKVCDENTLVLDYFPPHHRTRFWRHVTVFRLDDFFLLQWVILDRASKQKNKNRFIRGFWEEHFCFWQLKLTSNLLPDNTPLQRKSKNLVFCRVSSNKWIHVLQKFSSRARWSWMTSYGSSVSLLLPLLGKFFVKLAQEKQYL